MNIFIDKTSRRHFYVIRSTVVRIANFCYLLGKDVRGHFQISILTQYLNSVFLWCCERAAPTCTSCGGASEQSYKHQGH